MSKTIYIYGLKESGTNEIRYIGKAKNPEKRRLQHLADVLLAPRIEKSKWVKQVLGRDNTVEMVILEVCDKANWREREMYWINFYQSEGTSLTNMKLAIHPPKPNKVIKIRRLMTSGEAGRVLGLSSNDIRKLYFQEKLPGILEGGWKGITPRLKIEPHDLFRYAKRNGLNYDREAAYEIHQEMAPLEAIDLSTPDGLIAALPYVMKPLNQHELEEFVRQMFKMFRDIGIDVDAIVLKWRSDY